MIRTTRFDRECPDLNALTEEYRTALALAEAGLLSEEDAERRLESARAAIDAYMEKQGFDKTPPIECREWERLVKRSMEETSCESTS